MKKYNVAVVGVGAVGIEMLRCLKKRHFPIQELRVFARSARDIELDGERYSLRTWHFRMFSGLSPCLPGQRVKKGRLSPTPLRPLKEGLLLLIMAPISE